MKITEDPDDDKATLPYRLSRVLRRLYDWAARKTARHGRDVKHQFIRGASYGVGSGAVSLLVIWWENRH